MNLEFKFLNNLFSNIFYQVSQPRMNILTAIFAIQLKVALTNSYLMSIFHLFIQ